MNQITSATKNAKNVTEPGESSQVQSMNSGTSRTYQLLEIVLVFLPVLLIIVGFRLMKLENPMIFISAIWVGNILMLAIIGLGILGRNETWESIGVSFQRPSISRIGSTILKSVPIFIFAIVAFIFGAIIMANIVGIPEGADMTKYNFLRGNLPLLIVSLAGAYIVSSFGEEVVYRGFLITRLETIFGGNSRFALIAALALSSIIFGFAHFEWGVTGIVQTTFMGAAFGASFLITKRILWPLILAHCYMDTILFVQLYLSP